MRSDGRASAVAAVGRVGLYGGVFRDGTVPREVVAELEEAGYGAIWVPTAEPDLGAVEELVRATTRMAVATGVVSIWAAPARDLAAAYHRVDATGAGRVLLGVGISHAPIVERTGQRYDRPLERMRTYLDELDGAEAPVPAEAIVIGANGPKMLELAAARSAGAHPYLVTPEHTASARSALGPRPLLAPEQKVIIEQDAATARALARRLLGIYLGLPNYVRNLKRIGFTDDDLAGEGSDRLVDSLVAWGDAEAIAARVRAHHEAGADHVAVHVLGEDRSTPPLAAWRALAEVLDLQPRDGDDRR